VRVVSHFLLVCPALESFGTRSGQEGESVSKGVFGDRFVGLSRLFFFPRQDSEDSGGIQRKGHERLVASPAARRRARPFLRADSGLVAGLQPWRDLLRYGGP